MFSLFYFTKMVYVERMSHKTETIRVKEKVKQNNSKKAILVEKENTIYSELKISSPLTNFRRIRIGGYWYVLTAQVQHIGKNVNKGHYVTYLHEGDQITIINDSEVTIGNLIDHRGEIIDYEKGDEECCVLLYKLDYSDTSKVAISSDGISNNSNVQFSSSIPNIDYYGNILIGFKWKDNTCSPDTHMSNLRLIYIYYFDLTQKEKFNIDWPEISKVLNVKNDKLPEAKEKFISLVYDVPIDSFGKAMVSKKSVKGAALAPAPAPSSKIVYKEGETIVINDSDPDASTTPVYGLYMSLSLVQHQLFETVSVPNPFKSSIYTQFMAVKKCSNSGCKNHNKKVVEFKDDHMTDLYHPGRDKSHQNFINEIENESLDQRIEFIISRKFKLRTYVCEVCKFELYDESIGISIYPNLLIFDCLSYKFSTTDIYVQDNIMVYKKKYKLVAVGYGRGKHFVGKFKHTDNVIYDYDGMQYEGKLQSTKETKFENKKANFLYYIPND